MVMPASRSWACITSASWTLIGMLLVVIVKVKPFGWPPSASFARARARSRLIGGILLWLGQLRGGCGALAGPPPLGRPPLTVGLAAPREANAPRRGPGANAGVR